MIDWNNATGLQLAMVQDALLHAFPLLQSFDTFLLLRLNRGFNLLVPAGLTYPNGIVAILLDARGNGWLGDLIAAALAEKPGNPRLKALAHLSDLTAAQGPAGRSLEDIVRKDAGFQDVLPWIRRLDRLRTQVCRIERPVNQGIGTGWLVGHDLVLTNGHVAHRIIADASTASQHVCRFDYATDENKTDPGFTVDFAADPIKGSSPASPSELGINATTPTAAYLDYALLKLAQPIGNKPGPIGAKRGWIETSISTQPPADNSLLLILQHPSGDPIKLDLGVMLGERYGGVRLKHDVNTVGGSSGSPCFDVKLNLVALHNSGDPAYDGHGAAKENHAVPIGKVLQGLKASGAPKFWM
jgi:hypothetical protein